MENLEVVLAEKGIEAATKLAAESLGKVASAPAKELGEFLTDKIRFWRLENFVSFAAKYQKIIAEAGMEQAPLPLKLWFPILDNSSLEEDENLQRKWAALLANAANPDSDVGVLSAFVGILGQISPRQTVLLDWLYKGEDEPEGMVSGTETSNVCQVGLTDASLMLAHLSQVGILRVATESHQGPVVSGSHYTATSFGLAFVKACRAPSTAERKKTL